MNAGTPPGWHVPADNAAANMGLMEGFTQEELDYLLAPVSSELPMDCQDWGSDAYLASMPDFGQQPPVSRQAPTGQDLPSININNFDPPPIAQPSTDNITTGRTAPELTYSATGSSFPGTSLKGSLQDTNPACACLSRLYFALDPITILPGTKTVPFVFVRDVRRACRTVHDVIQCPTCIPPEGYESVEYHTVTVTTMLTLCYLLRCLVEAYRRILRIIDAQAMDAQASGNSLCYSLADFGGIWGTPYHPSGEGNWCGPCSDFVQQSTCGCALARFDRHDLDPRQWRLALRALLKADFCGLVRSDTDGCEGFMHKGLWYMVAEMEENSQQGGVGVGVFLETAVAPLIGSFGRHQGHVRVGISQYRQTIAEAKEAVDTAYTW